MKRKGKNSSESKLKKLLKAIPGMTVSDKVLNAYALNLLYMSDKRLYNFISTHFITFISYDSGPETPDNLRIMRWIEELKKSRTEAKKKRKKK